MDDALDLPPPTQDAYIYTACITRITTVNCSISLKLSYGGGPPSQGVAKLLGALHPKGTTELLPLYETPPTSPVHNASGWLVFLGREGGLTRPGSVLKGMSKNT